MALALIVGFVLGLLGAVPIAGPIAVLVVHRGLEGSPRDALSIAAGSAVAEGVYAAMAFLGFGSLLERHAWLDPLARATGACVLGALAVVLWRRSSGAAGPATRPRPATGPGPARGTAAAFGLGLTIAATNPAMVLSWMSAVAIVQAAGWLSPGSAHAVAFALGTTLGILAWSALLVGVVMRVRDRAGPTLLARVQRGAAWLVGALALVCLWQTFAWFA